MHPRTPFGNGRAPAPRYSHPPHHIPSHHSYHHPSLGLPPHPAHYYSHQYPPMPFHYSSSFHPRPHSHLPPFQPADPRLHPHRAPPSHPPYPHSPKYTQYPHRAPPDHPQYPHPRFPSPPIHYQPHTKSLSHPPPTPITVVSPSTTYSPTIATVSSPPATVPPSTTYSPTIATVSSPPATVPPSTTYSTTIATVSSPPATVPPSTTYSTTIATVSSPPATVPPSTTYSPTIAIVSSPPATVPASTPVSSECATPSSSPTHSPAVMSSTLSSDRPFTPPDPNVINLPPVPAAVSPAISDSIMIDSSGDEDVKESTTNSKPCNSKKKAATNTTRKTRSSSKSTCKFGKRSATSYPPLQSDGAKPKGPIKRKATYVKEAPKNKVLSTHKKTSEDDFIFKDSSYTVQEKDLYPADLKADRMLQEVIYRYPQCDQGMVKRILDNVFESKKVRWDDLGGMPRIKEQLKEMVVYPMLNPDLFRGLRDPGRGLLLFGPPGTGKTLIGKCLATEAEATFFSVTSSTFASKWFGDSESLTKSLFQCARALQPSIIFIDEVDSVLSQRTETENGASMRVKNEILTQMDGCVTDESDRVLVIGATNYPFRIDEAARRRFTKRLYIPLPDAEGREDILRNILKKEKHSITDIEFEEAASKTEGFTGADLKVVCRAAAMEPVKELPSIMFATLDDVRPITFKDLLRSISNNPPTVGVGDTKLLEDFNEQFGTRC